MERKELTFIYWTWSDGRLEEGEEEFPMRSAVHLGSKDSIYKKHREEPGKEGKAQQRARIWCEVIPALRIPHTHTG